MFPPTPFPITPATSVTAPRRPVALITGGGRGIGRLLAQALAGRGMAVGLVARSAGELAETVDLVARAGGTAAAAPADVTDRDALAGALAELRRRLGPVDLLVNNAGIVGPVGPLWLTDPQDWWTTMDVNLRGLLLTTQLVVPEMVARGRGRIINMASQAGTYRWPLVSAYSVSKAAVVKLTENLAHEVGRHGVRVFSVHPGLLPIGMSEDFAARPPVDAYEAHVRDWAAARAGGGPRRRAGPGRRADPAAGRRRRRCPVRPSPVGARRPRQRARPAGRGAGGRPLRHAARAADRPAVGPDPGLLPGPVGGHVAARPRDACSQVGGLG